MCNVCFMIAGIVVHPIIAIFAASCGPDAWVGPGQGEADAEMDISGANSNFLVKLTSDMIAESSEPGEGIGSCFWVRRRGVALGGC